MPPSATGTRAESESSIPSVSLRSPQRSRVSACVVYLSLLLLLFIQPLTRLMFYAATSDLHSHILLVPLITAYLLWTRPTRGRATYRTSAFGGIVMIGIGLFALWARLHWSDRLSTNDDLAIMAFAFVSFVAAGGFLFLGAKWMASAAFPLAFLGFMIPMPDVVRNYLETASMFASADAAALFFNVTGTPVVRDGTVFELPGITLRVAEECSGIHSSWALFITSVLASWLFLKRPWRRIVLVLFVIPLGILRNGCRVFAIALLCIHFGPHMIDSPIHHRGGPLFFALSLVPFLFVVWWLRHQEQTSAS